MIHLPIGTNSPRMTGRQCQEEIKPLGEARDRTPQKRRNEWRMAAGPAMHYWAFGR